MRFSLFRRHVSSARSHAVVAAAVVAALAASGALATAPSTTTAGALATGADDAALDRLALRRAADGGAREAAARVAVPALAPRTVTVRSPVPRFVIDPGQMITTVGKRASLMRIIAKNRGALVRRAGLKIDSFVARGTAHDRVSGRVAIAAIDRVIVFEPNSGEVTVFTSMGTGEEPLGFANDVVFDQDGKILVADMGAETKGETPTDGRVWRIDLETGKSLRVGANKKLSNPRLISLDDKMVPVFVDGEAGELIAAGATPRYDVVYRLTGGKQKRATMDFNDAGLTATAMAVDETGRHWYGTVTGLAILEDKVLDDICGIVTPFRFVNGIGLQGETRYALDTDAGSGDRVTLYDIDETCTVRARARTSKIKGARGLALVPDAED